MKTVYGKIFDYRKWESVRQFVYLLEGLDFLSLLEFRKFCFTEMLMGSERSVCKSMLYSYKVGKEHSNFEPKVSGAHMKCKLCDKLGSSI